MPLFADSDDQLTRPWLCGMQSQGRASWLLLLIFYLCRIAVVTSTQSKRQLAWSKVERSAQPQSTARCLEQPVLGPGACALQAGPAAKVLMMRHVGDDGELDGEIKEAWRQQPRPELGTLSWMCMQPTHRRAAYRLASMQHTCKHSICCQASCVLCRSATDANSSLSNLHPLTRMTSIKILAHSYASGYITVTYTAADPENTYRIRLMSPGMQQLRAGSKPLLTIAYAFAILQQQDRCQ